MYSGMGRTASLGKTAYSERTPAASEPVETIRFELFAFQSCQNTEVTRSPTLYSVTSFPSATISPAPSESGTRGNSILGL